MKQKKKKIAFVIGALTPGGAERVISVLSNELIEKFEVTIITFVKSDPFYPLDSRIEVVSCFNKIDKPKSLIGSLKLNYALTKKLSKIVKDQRIDLLIGFITSANVLTTIAAKLNRIPCLISERNDPLKKSIPKLWVILRKFVYPMANHLVVQTKKVKIIYETIVKPEKITILPNPISPKLSESRNSSTPREKIILSVGRLNDDKRQDKIIKAFQKLNLKEWKLLLIGDGPNKKKLITLINKSSLSHEVEILSGIKDVGKFYNKSSLFVFTSKAEGFPNVLLEAMHFGLPCISTDCNYGPSDLITNGKNGFLVPVNDQEALILKMSQLINDENLKTQFSIEARKTTENYMSKIVTTKWESLILNHIK